MWLFMFIMKCFMAEMPRRCDEWRARSGVSLAQVWVARSFVYCFTRRRERVSSFYKARGVEARSFSAQDRDARCRLWSGWSSSSGPSSSSSARRKSSTAEIIQMRSTPSIRRSWSPTHTLHRYLSLYLSIHPSIHLDWQKYWHHFFRTEKTLPNLWQQRWKHNSCI